MEFAKGGDKREDGSPPSEVQGQSPAVGVWWRSPQKPVTHANFQLRRGDMHFSLFDLHAAGV